jgi:UDP:flavonoid glycosyltransferase YjiC (YdhE family)
LSPEEGDAAAVRRAVSRLLGDASFRDAARRISSSIAAMPSPEVVAAVLENVR